MVMAELKPQDFAENVALFKLLKNYDRLKDVESNMWDFELYEASRGYWVMNLKEAKEQLKYAMPVYDGKILEVYEVADWYEAGTTLRSPKYIDSDDNPNRCEFVGKIAAPDIRNKYKGNTVSGLYEAPKVNSVRIITDGKLKSEK